jgi:uncharacterized membrane protein YgcG
VREPLEGWTPNEVGYLWKWGGLDVHDMTATLMDLVRRGALRLLVTKETHPRLGGLLGRAVEEEQYLERVREFEGELRSSERYFINDILFRGLSPGERVSMEQLRASTKEHPTAAYSRYRRWKKLAEGESERLPLIDPKSKVAMGVGMAIGVFMFVSMFALVAALQSPVAIVTGFVGFGLIPASTAMRRRNTQAAMALHQWQAFRRYLTDFSRLKEHPAPAVALWEQYLVFAVTLGVAERVIEQFKELYPTVVSQGQVSAALFPNWVSHGGTPFSSMDSISSAFSSFTSSFATATSSFSSSSGSGGGFSGGGGGGGGGGSSGAR